MNVIGKFLRFVSYFYKMRKVVLVFLGCFWLCLFFFYSFFVEIEIKSLLLKTFLCI